ncbi:hypothetical protein FRX31_023186 [Thalictrum thalictroides]|uniref:Uncharacterized protein n=1 Tax=Thalictrum thalictroides TaxID=46969 RepID=A0A7J6VRM4_THATH|nr:hypothetical protein FRX31_023186 [Thalictrum thalictroides]
MISLSASSHQSVRMRAETSPNYESHSRVPNSLFTFIYHIVKHGGVGDIIKGFEARLKASNAAEHNQI